MRFKKLKKTFKKISVEAVVLACLVFVLIALGAPAMRALRLIDIF